MTRLPSPRLFQEKLLRNEVSNFRFPSDLAVKHQVLQQWVRVHLSFAMSINT